MYFQPILNADTAELSSLEALIRWDRPGFGMTPPDVFIPIAERTDLISQVDNWVIRHVLGQLEAWAVTPGLRNVPISINISGRHLAADSFVSDILDPILNAGIDPSRLILEITESALLDDLDSAAEKLQALRDHSIKIAIDDFGTGYTSLGHLRSLPIDILKIDRSFISDESASSLVKLIIDTGHLIGASITSEGIETAAQAEHFTALGSDALQGYLFARPMPAAAVERELQITTPDHMPFLG
jgi:EAL domain-containing protein (putative c-di-GMP-specific phosphodiesterase class I)